MLKVPHVTRANFDKYGEALLAVTRKYAAEKKSLLFVIFIDNSQQTPKHSDPFFVLPQKFSTRRTRIASTWR